MLLVVRRNLGLGRLGAETEAATLCDSCRDQLRSSGCKERRVRAAGSHHSVESLKQGLFLAGPSSTTPSLASLPHQSRPCLGSAARDRRRTAERRPVARALALWRLDFAICEHGVWHSAPCALLLLPEVHLEQLIIFIIIVMIIQYYYYYYYYYYDCYCLCTCYYYYYCYYCCCCC